MIIRALSFCESEQIPGRFTCEGDNINPLLSIDGVPDGARSLVLIMDDPDATRGETWDHWVVWNIPPETREIPEGWSAPADIKQGTTSFGDQKYGGPCPPPGVKPHRYVFKLYALDTVLDIPVESTKKDVEKAMAGKVIAEARTIGLFGR